MNFITKVEFKILRPGWDRRGTIAIFHLKEAPNFKYVQYKALKLLWTVTSLLSDTYSPRSYEELVVDDYFSEGNECWIVPSERYQVTVSHKYWSDNQIICFKNMIHSLAALYGWEVVNEEKYKFRNLPVTMSGWHISGEYSDGSGGGILEWCENEADAKKMLAWMIRFPEFKNLKIGQE
jgi:hypothetical protein